MNIKSIANAIASKQGIISVRVEDLQTREDFSAGEIDERQRKAMRALCQLSEVFGHKEHVRACVGESVRADSGSRTIVCFTDDTVSVTVVVMIPTGAPIAKSLNRMVRRTLSAASKGKLPRAA